MTGANQIVVPLGAQVTCTIVNMDNTPQLKLVKTVTNNDGGTTVASDCTLSAIAVAPDPTGRNFNGPGGSGAFQNVFAGATYVLSESPNPGTGYSSSGIWSCTAGTIHAPEPIVGPPGAQVTCTIVNTDDTPSLKLVKTVVNDNGGTAVPTTGRCPRLRLPRTTAATSTTWVAPAASRTCSPARPYTLSENPSPGTGYSSTGQWSWTAGGTLGAGKTVVTVALGAQVTCTITNNDKTPQLKLVKTVINNDGGTAVAND